MWRNPRGQNAFARQLYLLLRKLSYTHFWCMYLLFYLWVRQGDHQCLFIQCIGKVFRPLDFFHISLQPYSKMDYIVFPPTINLHTISHNDKAKLVIRIFWKCIKKNKKTGISHLHKYSYHLLSTSDVPIWHFWLIPISNIFLAKKTLIPITDI
jgi:hypothetical protein